MSRSLRVPLWALAVAALAFATSAPSALAEREDDDPVSWAFLTVEPGLPTRLEFTRQGPVDPAVAAALERIAVRPTEMSDYAPGWVRWVAELPPPSGDRLVLRQTLDLGPLLAALHAAGQTNLTLVIRHPRAGFATLTGAGVLARQPGTMNAYLRTGGSHEPLRLELGWHRADIARAVILLLLALLAPIAAGLAVRARSIARDRAAEAWFGRVQAIHVITIVGWVLWMAAVEATRVAEVIEFARIGPAWLRTIATPLWVLAFLPAGFALGAIARDVARRLRGFDPLPRGVMHGQLRPLVPVVLVLVAVTTFAAGDVRSGVFALLAAIAAGALMPGARGPLGTTPQALSSGALRDRLFDLARRAGVKLRELYVVPMRRERMANAFAVNGGVVMVADELLDRMSRREVDAVLAHEISHLEHHHPIRMVLGAAGAWVSIALVAIPLGMPFMVPAGVVVAWLTYLFLSRRCEFAADAGAAALTGDAEAMISGLGQLARLNDAPLAWGRGARWAITHPTTEARGLAIGRRAGIEPGRVRELLERGLPAAERYGHAERPGEGERAFSTAWKNTVIMRLSLALLAAAVVAPAAALAIARALGYTPPHAVAIFAGIALACGAVLLVQDLLAAGPVSALESAVRRRLGDPPGEAAIFVALSPGERPRVYEGFLDWDLGLLSIAPDRLRYRGEQTSLELPREAVRGIETGAVMPNWIRAPRVIVRWSAPTGEESLTLRPADAKRVSAIGPASRALAARLDAWRRAGNTAGAAGPGAPAHLIPAGSPPGIGPVTARTPAEAAAPRDLPLLAVLIGALSAGASFAFGLDLARGLDVFVASLLAMLVARAPAMTARERPPAAAAEPAPERRAA